MNLKCAKILTEIINKDITPYFKWKKLNIELGLFTSDNYGSYKVNFYDADDKIICYIIADNIIGNYKLFKNI